GTILGRLRLSHCPDRGRAYRRNGASRPRPWRHIVQDFHVLWRIWPAWALGQSARISYARSGGGYDIAHFEFIMRSAQRLMAKYPERAAHISVSLHCELADILEAYTKLVERDGTLTGLHAYSAARPAHSEGLAIWIASYLANETNCLNVNL